MASKLFEDCFCDAGTVRAVCDFCGKCHFGDSAGDLPVEELEELLECAKKEPDKYEYHGDCSIGLGLIGGKNFVWQCGCNGIQKYEDFIWSSRVQILKYFKKRKESIQQNLQEIDKRLKDLE